MDFLKEREALIAEIEVFKAEMLKIYVIKSWADSYVNTDPFSYVFTNDGNNKIWWMKAQTHELWQIWQAAKSQAVPEWKDYSQQSPRIDGRYQIFINGEQLAADWKSPFGFADPIEGVAFIQELITHWAVLSADPVTGVQEQSHE